LRSALPLEATVVRFYTWHVVGLAIPAVALIAWHAFRVRRDGGISRRPQRDGARPERIHRRELVRKEGLAALALTALLLLLSLLFDAPLGAAVDPLVGGETVHAPWFFLWMQALLRSLPPLVAGVALPLLALLALALLPWLLDPSEGGVAHWFNRPGRRAQLLALALAGAITALTVWEALR
jgi:quinol-cytochrome oxidoreductase complex cytochrome b subunit